MKLFISELEKGYKECEAYDIISKHYYEFRKEELSDIILEFIYTTKNKPYLHQEVAQELKDRYDY